MVKKLLAILLLAGEVPMALADAVYSFVGPTYTSVGAYTVCGPRPCADYTGKQITGSITTSAPLPRNASLSLFAADITAFSFSDGVFTYTNADPDVRLEGFGLTTDSQGHVTGGGGIIAKWLSGSSPHSAGDIYRSLSFDSLFLQTSVVNNLQTVGVSAQDWPAVGHALLPESSSGYAPAGAGGAWTSVLPAPTVGGLSPGFSTPAGGALVTLNGTNLMDGATVTIGGVAAGTVAWVSNTEIQVVIPPGTPGVKNVVVTNPDAQSATLVGGFTYAWPAPSLSGLTPSSGPTTGGTGVTLNGANFQNGATVTIGGVTASPVTWVSASALQVTVPPGSPGAKTVVVTNPDAQSVSLAGAYTYVLPMPGTPASVPTLSQWGMMLLAAFLAIIGVQRSDAWTRSKGERP